MKLTIHCPVCGDPLTDVHSAENCKVSFFTERPVADAIYRLDMECLECETTYGINVTVSPREEE